jgi:DNA-binding transcriptional LysR family regulator
MDSRRLMTFRAVAHERSFSRAARSLQLSQPSVSQQVALLETEVGVRLIDRGRGGLRLTHAGTVLLEHADNVAWRLELAASQLAELATERRTELRIGSFPTALAGFVPSAIAHLQERHPGVRFLISEVTPSTLEPRLLAGEFDVAVSYQFASNERREIAGARRTDLLQESFLVALPPDHRLAGSTDPIAIATLADDDWVVPSMDGFIAQSCRAAGFEPRVTCITQDPLTMRGLVSRGLAVGLVPSLLADAYDGITLHAIADSTPLRDVFAVIPPGEPHPLAEQALRALVDTAAVHAPT